MHAAICLQQHFPGYVRCDAFRKALEHMLSQGEIHLRAMLSASVITVFGGGATHYYHNFPPLFCARMSQERFIVI